MKALGLANKISKGKSGIWKEKHYVFFIFKWFLRFIKDYARCGRKKYGIRQYKRHMAHNIARLWFRGLLESAPVLRHFWVWKPHWVSTERKSKWEPCEQTQAGFRGKPAEEGGGWELDRPTREAHSNQKAMEFPSRVLQLSAMLEWNMFDFPDLILRPLWEVLTSPHEGWLSAFID